MTWWNLNQTQQVANENLKNARETLKVTQEGQVTDRFLRAVEQLGNKDRTELRLGAIYSLERISRTSEADYWPIIELICAFLRSNAPVSDTTESPTHRAKHSILASEAAHRGEDIQAAITMIGRRRNPSRGDEPVALYLAFVDLSDLHLEQANLAGAVLWSTSFKGAVLAQADLRGARLTAASLENANLTEARLQNALLSATNMEGATLTRAHLQGAYLTDARRVTFQQLAEAYIDEKTKLPPEISQKQRDLLLKQRPSEQIPESANS